MTSFPATIMSYLLLCKIYYAIKEMGSRYIQLVDASRIDFDGCFIDLECHYILLYGYSWYNKYGYYFDNNENELISNGIFETRKLQFYRDEYDVVCDKIIEFLIEFHNIIGLCIFI